MRDTHKKALALRSSPGFWVVATPHRDHEIISPSRPTKKPWRWNIKVFFKHIKTHLRIKSFVGTSENAVKIQIWTSLIAIILPNALQQIAKYKWHLSNLINALRLPLFAKIALYQFIDKPFEKNSQLEQENIQLSLFT